MDYDILTSCIIRIAVFIVTIIITRFIVPFIKTKISDQKLDAIRRYASIFVNGIEQKIRESGAGEEKKRQVLELLTDKVNSIGIKLSADDIDLIIEEAVKDMKEYS